MTPEALARFHQMKAASMAAEARSRHGGSSTLPRTQSKTTSEDGRFREQRLTGHPSSSSVYDNVSGSGHGHGSGGSVQRRGKPSSSQAPVPTTSAQVIYTFYLFLKSL